jgi:hypothetical protein
VWNTDRAGGSGANEDNVYIINGLDKGNVYREVGKDIRLEWLRTNWRG